MHNWNFHFHWWYFYTRTHDRRPHSNYRNVSSNTFPTHIFILPNKGHMQFRLNYCLIQFSCFINNLKRNHRKNNPPKYYNKQYWIKATILCSVCDDAATSRYFLCVPLVKNNIIMKHSCKWMVPLKLIMIMTISCLFPTTTSHLMHFTSLFII